MTYETHPSNSRLVFRRGFQDALPIGLGYFAVSFSLGIAAKASGLNPFQSFLASILCNASAGEYAGFTLIAAGAGLAEIALMTLIANARYLLMSCAMSARIDPECSIGHRCLMAFDLTDELFALAIRQPGTLNPFYTYGAMANTIPYWAIGTALGCIAGALLPNWLVSALSVALFGMFLSVIIPPCRTEKPLRILVIVSFLTSGLFAYMPILSSIPEGIRTIVLTLLLASAAAYFVPHTEVC